MLRLEAWLREASQDLFGRDQPWPDGTHGGPDTRSMVHPPPRAGMFGWH